MKRIITVEHEGSTYSAKIATVTSTHLGPEGHGIFTAYLQCEGDGWGVGVGGYALGGGFGMEHIKALLDTVGVERWEDIPGSQVLVLFDGKDAWGQVARGIAHISDEKRVLDLAQHAAEWKARQAEEATA